MLMLNTIYDPYVCEIVTYVVFGLPFPRCAMLCSPVFHNIYVSLLCYAMLCSPLVSHNIKIHLQSILGSFIHIHNFLDF